MTNEPPLLSASQLDNVTIEINDHWVKVEVQTSMGPIAIKERRDTFSPPPRQTAASLLSSVAARMDMADNDEATRDMSQRIRHALISDGFKDDRGPFLTTPAGEPYVMSPLRKIDS